MTARAWPLLGPALGAGVTFGLLLLAWSWVTGPGGLSPTILPAPMAVAEALHHGWINGALHRHAVATLSGAALGLLIGATCGTIAGFAFAASRPLERAFLPLVTGIQSVPKIALAPLIVAYVGFGLASKVLTVALLCFFPMVLAAFFGARAAPRPLLDLYRLHGASPWRTFVRVIAPAAAPSLFAGLQLCVVLSITGCVVAEFIAAQAGLGFVIKNRMGTLEVSMMFAAIVSLALIGAVVSLAVGWLRRRALFWLEDTR
jgi:NitT/TauT family transport system permease protein